MEAGHTGIGQQRYKNTQLGLHHTGIAVVGIFLPDGQLVVDGNLRQTAADGFDGLHRKAGTVLGAAAVFIRAVVKTVELKLPHMRSPWTCTISNPALTASTAASPKPLMILWILRVDSLLM